LTPGFPADEQCNIGKKEEQNKVPAKKLQNVAAARTKEKKIEEKEHSRYFRSALAPCQAGAPG